MAWLVTWLVTWLATWCLVYLPGGDKKGGIAVYDITKKNVHGINQYQSVCSVSSESQHSHEFSANTVAWYPHDNGMFISCSYDNHVKVWDTNTMKPVEDFTVGRVSHVSMSTKKGKTSSLIACALSDNTVKLCDMTSGASTHVLRGHVASVNTVVWSKRNQYALFSSGKDGKIITYDIRRSTPAIHFFDHANRGSSETAHSGEVTSLTQTECGLYLVSSSNDRQIRVWNTNSGLNTMTNFDPMQTSQATTVTAALSTSACYPGLLYLPLGTLLFSLSLSLSLISLFLSLFHFLSLPPLLLSLSLSLYLFLSLSLSLSFFVSLTHSLSFFVSLSVSVTPKTFF